MSFVHFHSPGTQPQPTDVCLVIQCDRLLAHPDATEAVRLPSFASVGGWLASFVKPMQIGTLGESPLWLSVIEDADVSPPDGWQWHETRALLNVFTAAQWHAVSCARELSWWDQRHRFCGACGTPTMDSADERARRCPTCAAVFFPVVSTAVIVAVTRGDELLLAHNRNFRPGMFSLLAGFVDPGETLEQAVVREVREEVGVEVDTLRYVTSQPWPFPNSMMVGFRANYVRGEIVVDGKEIEEAAWYRRDALPEIPRTGTVARQIIDQWLQR